MPRLCRRFHSRERYIEVGNGVGELQIATFTGQLVRIGEVHSNIAGTHNLVRSDRNLVTAEGLRVGIIAADRPRGQTPQRMSMNKPAIPNPKSKIQNPKSKIPSPLSRVGGLPFSQDFFTLLAVSGFYSLSVSADRNGSLEDRWNSVGVVRYGID